MYVNHWNVAQSLKYYDALQDHYATFYFANPTVKKHLKIFTKVVKKQPKTSDHLRLTVLLQNKYKRYEKINDSMNKSSNRQSINEPILGSNKNSLKHQSLQKLKKIQKHQLHPQQNYHFNPNYDQQQKVQSSQKINNKINRAESLDRKLPKVKHNKIYRSHNQQTQFQPTNKKIFADYLEKKKEEIQKKL